MSSKVVQVASFGKSEHPAVCRGATAACGGVSCHVTPDVRSRTVPTLGGSWWGTVAVVASFQ